MRSVFVYISGRLKEMPLPLHWLTAFSVFVPVFVLGFYVRGGPQVHIGLSEVLLTAVCCAVFIYGFLQATPWSRPLIVLMFVAFTIKAIIQIHTKHSFSNFLGLLATDGFIVWTLYFRGDVRNYYARARKPVT